MQLEKTEDNFLELYGALVGDGCIVRFKRKDRSHVEAYRIFITGNAKTDLEYVKQHLSCLFSKYGINAYIHLRKPTNSHNINSVDLVVNNKEFALLLMNLGFPVGKKGNITLPEWLMKLPKEKKTNVVRGLFDTDGCMSARKSEQYRRPFMLISSKSIPLLRQLKEIIRELGLPAYVSGFNVGVNGIENTKKWFSTIGSKNPRNILRYQEWIRTGRLPMAHIKTKSPLK